MLSTVKRNPFRSKHLLRGVEGKGLSTPSPEHSVPPRTRRPVSVVPPDPNESCPAQKGKQGSNGGRRDAVAPRTGPNTVEEPSTTVRTERVCRRSRRRDTTRSSTGREDPCRSRRRDCRGRVTGCALHGETTLSPHPGGRVRPYSCDLVNLSFCLVL